METCRMRSLPREDQAEVLGTGGQMGLSVSKATACSSDNGGHLAGIFGEVARSEAGRDCSLFASVRSQNLLHV